MGSEGGGEGESTSFSVLGKLDPFMVFGVFFRVDFIFSEKGGGRISLDSFKAAQHM